MSRAAREARRNKLTSGQQSTATKSLQIDALQASYRQASHDFTMSLLEIVCPTTNAFNNLLYYDRRDGRAKLDDPYEYYNLVWLVKQYTPSAVDMTLLYLLYVEIAGRMVVDDWHRMHGYARGLNSCYDIGF
jgi:hypothetical protein